ncbi:MAG: hydroxyacid dehydrogenase [Halobacteriaceae archaeon]
MDILVTVPGTGSRGGFFPAETRERLESLGTVEWNETGDQFTESDLRERIPGVDVLVTGWGSPQVTASVVEAADDLSLVAHTGGSVADIASEAAYDAGVRVVSANDEMARFVAEQTVAAVVAHRRRLPALDRAMRDGAWDADVTIESLHGSSVGLVGLGTIGRHVLDHLASWDVSVAVYDPYIDDEALADWPFASLAPLDDALSSDVVSLHASLTPETEGMVGEDELAHLPDGALFVNTARAGLVEADAMLAELRSGRLDAVLDVFHEEPLPEDHELRTLDNVLLTPHTGGSRIRAPLTESVLDDVERWQAGESLAHEISREQWTLMTPV